MAYGVYDAKKVSIVITEENGNSWKVTGVGEDMASGDKDEEFSSFSAGAQGDIVESVINNPLGTISLTVQKTCPQLHALIGLKGKPFGIMVTDYNINLRYGGSVAKLKKYPETANGSEAEDFSFEIQVIDYDVEAIATMRQM